MKYLLLVLLFVCLLLLGSTHAAQALNIVPSPKCLGSCPTTAVSPSQSVSSAPSSIPSAAPSAATSVAPSQSVSSAPSNNPSPSSAPCTASAAVSSQSVSSHGSVSALHHGHAHHGGGGKKHSSGNQGLLQQFIQFLLQLLQQLFKQLGISLPIPGSGCPTPSPSGAPSAAPSSSVSNSPSSAPSGSGGGGPSTAPSANPSTGVPTPTIFGVSPSPSSGVPTPTSGTVNASCAKGGSYLWSNLAACGWPGPTNTGPVMSQCPNGLTANGTNPTGTITFSTANAVISCEKITGNVDITANNVTIKNSTISANSGKTGEAANGTGSIKIEDGASAIIDHNSINGNDAVHACIWDQGTSMTATYNNCTGMNDGIFSWADTSYSQTTGDNFDIENNYEHGFTTATANGHIDGYQTEGANNGKIIHNTIDVSQDQDSDVAIWDSLKSSSNITVSNNLLAGGGFAVYSEDYSPSQANPVGGFTETNIHFTDNKFSTIHFPCVGSFGVWFDVSNAYNGGATDGWHRSGNVVLETGQNVDNGNPGSCN